MALFTRIVLLTLVSSEISLGQRKHGRNFPVAADVKPGLNFDCPEEFGYYPHPNDCTQYYVCVFGGALLESCTGGLMYSHELQTCDWPRNVGCDSGVEAATTPPSTYSSSSSIRVQESKVRYTHPPPPPPPAQPAAIVTSRGQPRQLQHNQQDLIKQKQQQQQQLYDEADDALPPAEEIENDRQQRVYRGQPSTIGQVQKDRDGLRHHTNAIPSSSNGVEKIGVISFGSQQQSLQEYRNLTDEIDNFLTNDLTFKRRKRQTKQRVENQSNRPVEQVYSTVRSKPVYNNSQSYDSRYDPYYDLYEELDPELYKSVEYTQHYNNDPPTSQQTYRSTTAPTPTQVLIQEKIPKRGNSGYTQNSYSTQDTYRPSSISSYDKDERYNNNQDDGQGIYQQTNKQSSRRDQNEINYIEEPTSTKRIPTFKTTVSTPRQFSSVKNTKVPSSAESHEVQGAFPNYKLQRNSEYIHTTHTPNDTQIASDIIRPFSILLDVNLTPPQQNLNEKPIPFALPLDAVTPQSFHYVTKLSKSTSIVSTSDPSSKKQNSNCDHVNCEIIIPTTYSPSTSPFKYFISTQEIPASVYKKLGYRKPAETIDIRESVKPESEKEDESVTTPQNNFGGFQTTPDFQKKSQNSELKKSIPFDINSTSTFANENLNYLNSNDVINENIPIENNTLSLIPKQLEISPRPNPTKNIQKKVTPTLSYYPTRVSRVNMAIKSIVSFGGLPRPYTKCSDDQAPNAKCKQVKKRVNNRGRGSSHYSNSGPSEESVVVNRGTSPPRSRPTLKPSTSIVSKASEFIDIYKNPPRRPESIYPQPQPDKTAAKCRKDVCLLPDCSCGGKEIPGDLDVSQVPQMVLLTFDDAVNDLNMGYYSELFEKGRVNPNGCPIVSTFYVSHEWTDYSQVQNLYADGHEMASHTVSHSFGEQFSQKKWTKEIAGQREILSAYGGVRLDDVRGMRAPFLSVGGNKMFKMLYDSNFTYDSSLPVYENKPPSWPYTLDYKLFHDCMIPPCPTRSYPGVWEVPMVMWQDLNGGRCSMGDACSNPSDADGVFKMLMKNFERHYTTNRAPFGLFYHAAWFTQPHHKEGFIHFLDTINTMDDVWLLTNWQAIQWVRDPTPISRLSSFQPFGCNYPERPKRCNNPKVCNLWHKTGVRYMRTCQPCPDIYPWTGNTGIRSSRIDNEIED